MHRYQSNVLYHFFRLDETHVGFYVVDAVGHGMPAALLTMFIRRALQTKRISGNSYQIIPPHVAIGELNVDICQADLSSCQRLTRRRNWLKRCVCNALFQRRVCTSTLFFPFFAF